MGMKLKYLNAEYVLEWARYEAQIRPGRTRLGIRVLKAFYVGAHQSQNIEILFT